MTLLTVEYCDSIEFAKALLKHRAKTCIVEVSTGLPKSQIRKIYKTMFNESPKSGQMPQSIDNMLTDIQYKFQIMIFYRIYKKMYGDDIFERLFTLEVLNAYEGYLQTVFNSSRITPLSFTHAWVFARLLRSGLVVTDLCACGADFPNDSHTTSKLCPACEIKQSMYCDCGKRINRKQRCECKSGQYKKVA